VLLLGTEQSVVTWKRGIQLCMIGISGKLLLDAATILSSG
jgi:hypothetical protein